MLQTIDVGYRSVEAYRGVAGDEAIDDLRQQARRLQGCRVVHINATPYGGGVSELLRSIIPLMNSLGIIADWKVITGDKEFFEVTKRIHNGLQGTVRGLTDEDRAVYLSNAERNAKLFEETYDFVFIHDPQPAALLSFRDKGSARWVWRCHIDTSQPNRDVWKFLKAHLNSYDAAIFTMREFTPPDFPVDRVEIVPPAIDPLSPKNLPMPEPLQRQILDWIGIGTTDPLVTQISRFDPWKDPLGVIEAYRIARRTVPLLQLALVGSMALDDPEGWEVYQRILAAARNDPLIHVFTNLTGVGNIEVNAFQRLSDVIVQKSIREGFGLVVSESLWKGTPVVAGRAGGIPLQMADGVGGTLVNSIEECGEAITKMLEHAEAAKRSGEAGKERVQEHFLLPRLLLNEVGILASLSEDTKAHPAFAAHGIRRDPVCGMAVGDTNITLMTDQLYAFCSEACRNRFRIDPLRYTSGT